MAIKGTVSLEGVEFFARHGVYDFERENGNTFIVDIFLTQHYKVNELYSLDDTVDYEKVYSLTETVMNEPEALLETVAHKIQKALTHSFKSIEMVRIKIKKQHPPIKNAKLAYSAFELEWAANSVK